MREKEERKPATKSATLRLHAVLRIGLFLVIYALLVALISGQAYAKGETSKIVIKGPGLPSPIKIIDPKILADFQVWSGPGTSSDEKVSFIVNWSQGVVTEPPSGLPRYEVLFYAKLRGEQLIYIVSYEYDPATKQGYVYLPGKTDEWYNLDVSTIYHGVEGHWFHASRAWEEATRLLLAKTVIPPTSCHVTKPNGRKLPWQTFEPPGQRAAGQPGAEFWKYNEWHGNKAVTTFLPRNGVFVFQPGRNITLEDGSIATKFLWFKTRKPLSLSGHRLDATAPPLRVAVPEGYADQLFQPSQAIFPTQGCWQITSRVGRDSLKFTLWIVFEPPSTARRLQ